MSTLKHIRNLSVTQTFGLTPYVLALSAALSLAIIKAQSLLQRPSPRGYWLMMAGCAGLAAAIALIVTQKWRRRAPTHLPSTESGRAHRLIKAALLSTQAGILLLPVSVYLAVWRSHYDGLQWYANGFLDKRYLFSLYWIAILTVIVFPPFLWRILDKGDVPLASVGAVREDLGPGGHPGRADARRSLLTKASTVIIALLVAYFMYGPPWNLSGVPVTANFHEAVHLGPLQAIDKGYLPDIGPAAQGYGPGFQLALYGLMKASGGFTLQAFRGAQATIDFLGYCVFAVVAFQVLDVPYALLAVVLSVTASPFGSIPWEAAGSFNPWGWPNPLRYAGSLILVLLLARLLPARRESPTRLIIAGFAWAFLVWFSPENLLVGVIGAALLCALMWSTYTVTFARLVQGLSWVAVGCAICWLPIAGSYLWRGHLQDYVSNIFQVGREVLNGCSNTWVAGNILQSRYLTDITYLGPPVLVICALAVLYKGMSPVGPLDRRRLTLLALVLVSLTNYFGSMTRSDLNHLLNTLISLPILMALAIRDLPGLIATRPFRANLVRVATILAVLMFASDYSPSDLGFLSSQVSARIARFSYPASGNSDKGSPRGVALSRLGYASLAEQTPYLTKPAITVGELSSALDELHAIAGDQRVFVDSFPGVQPGLVYFVADLFPAPILADPTTMVFSSDDRHRFFQHFRGIAHEVDFLVTIDPELPEIRVFRAAHPDATVMMRILGAEKYYVYGVFNQSPVAWQSVRDPSEAPGPPACLGSYPPGQACGN